MSSRRRFLSTLGLGLAAAPLLLAQESRQRRSRWEMIANDDPVRTPEFRPIPSSWDNGTITAAWIGHSTVLINFYGLHIITDPVFSERIGLNIGGLFTIGPRRLVSPALSIEQLPPIDLILLSHAHMDHLDVPSLKKFDRKIPVIMASFATCALRRSRSSISVGVIRGNRTVHEGTGRAGVIMPTSSPGKEGTSSSAATPRITRCSNAYPRP
jgi:ribonuclease BN (tRNA processing enzyme)